MRLVRGEKNSEKRAFFASRPRHSTLGLLVVVATLSGAAQASPPTARATTQPPAAQAQSEQPVQATRAVAASATPQAIAVQQHVDRMAILAQERSEILAKLKKLDDGDKAGLARLQADLQSIDREIALVSRQPIHPTSSVATVQVTGAKTVSAAPMANQESQTNESEKITYEGWDIFKNFGRKGN